MMAFWPDLPLHEHTSWRLRLGGLYTAIDAPFLTVFHLYVHCDALIELESGVSHYSFYDDATDDPLYGMRTVSALRSEDWLLLEDLATFAIGFVSFFFLFLFMFDNSGRRVLIIPREDLPGMN